ncbi:hypothetical protein pb186bvf_015243 [Paramecium bursaria]
MKKINNRQAQILDNKINVEIFQDLVKTYGEGKWSLIADALELHGIHVSKPNQLLRIWNIIKRKQGEGLPITNTIDYRLLKLILQLNFNRKKVENQMFSDTQIQVYPEIIYLNFKKYFIQAMKALINLFVQKKKAYKQLIIQNYSVRTMKYLLKFRKMEFEEEFPNSIKRSSEILSQYLLDYHQLQELNRSDQYELFRDVLTKKIVTDMLDHFIYVSCMVLLIQGEDAKFEAMSKNAKYVTQDKEQIKESQFYKIMINMRNRTRLFDTYLQTLQNKQNDNSQYVIEILEENQNKTKHKVFLKKQEVKLINSSRTVRGRIKTRFNKNLRPSQIDEKFRTDMLAQLDEQDNDFEFNYQ